MTNLAELINSLKLKPSVDAVFLTGSQGDDHKPYSDIGLVVILDTHTQDLTSLYTWVDGKFADIFFFGHADLERITTAKDLPGNAMDGVFVGWLQKETIQFDKSGKVTELKDKVDELSKKIHIPKSEKSLFWQKVNYNLIANTRYFESNDPVYHEALEMRLLYSVSDVFTAYFEFRDIVWRGEKASMKYLKENDIAFYDAFIQYTKASNLNDKFKTYVELTHLALAGDYKLWNKGEVFPQSKDRAKANMQELVRYWEGLIK